MKLRVAWKCGWRPRPEVVLGAGKLHGAEVVLGAGPGCHRAPGGLHGSEVVLDMGKPHGSEVVLGPEVVLGMDKLHGSEVVLDVGKFHGAEVVLGIGRGHHNTPGKLHGSEVVHSPEGRAARALVASTHRAGAMARGSAQRRPETMPSITLGTLDR